jgi:hypothetical protein
MSYLLHCQVSRQSHRLIGRFITGIAVLLGCLLLALPAQATPVKFSDRLYEKFHHERCLQCHQFNSRRNNGRALHSHRNRYLCSQCHQQRITGIPSTEWMAPEGDKMDYTGFSARDTCLMMKRNAPAGDLRKALTHHLLDDMRIRWALESGKTPAGPVEILPGGRQEWKRDVEAWIKDGMLCE